MSKPSPKDKVKVFISSVCGEKRYDDIRMRLKKGIISTKIADAFVFEDPPASTKPVISSYIHKLDDSHICIFLIDNKDGPPSGVLREHKRASELSKKCVYLFCDADCTEPTQMQNEIASKGNCKYQVVHSFEEFISVGLISLVEDIVTIYRDYCSGRLAYPEDDITIIDKESTIEAPITRQTIIPSNKTRNSLLQWFDFKNTSMEDKEKDLDFYCSKFLGVVMGQKRWNEYIYIEINNCLGILHPQNIYEVIKLRWECIRNYYYGDLRAAHQSSKNAYELAVQIQDIPDWLINDLLIDMRNLEMQIDALGNIYRPKTDAQRLLDERNSKVYYPVIDRNESHLFEKNFNLLYERDTESIFTVHMGSSIEANCEIIAESFVIKCFYGSWTQITLTPRDMIPVLSTYSKLYQSHEMYIAWLCILATEHNGKGIDAAAKYHLQTTDTLHENDIEKICECVDNIPIFHERFKSKLIVLEKFAYYFSDYHFASFSYSLLKEIDEWIDEDETNRIVKVGEYIFPALKASAMRSDNERIAKIIVRLFIKRLKFFYDGALDCIRALKIEGLKEETQSILVNQIILVIKDKNAEATYRHLAPVILYIKEHCTISLNELDQVVLMHMSNTFQRDYTSDTIDYNNPVAFIYEQIKTIDQRNIIQGRGGAYIGWGDNPYGSLQNLIRINGKDLLDEQLVRMYDAIENTLIRSEQTISTKREAVCLAIEAYATIHDVTLIKNRLISTLSELIVQKHHCDYLFQDTEWIILFAARLFIAIIKEKMDYELIEMLSISANTKSAEHVQVLDLIETVTFNSKLLERNSSLLHTLAQYVVTSIYNEKEEIRLKAVYCLFDLAATELSTLALSQLSKCMDNDTMLVKRRILWRLETIKNKDEKMHEYMLNKGLADNHYLIRCIAQRIQNQSDI